MSLTRRGLLAAFAAPAARPNVILLLADDLGWGDTGFHGHQTLRTPHLDAMAAAGMRWERFYSAAPVCSPARGSVLTGRHPYRYGIYFANADNSVEGNSKYILPQPEFTLAEALRPLGYATGHFGKWHLGDFDGDRKSSPSDNGFDEWFSTVRKTSTYNPSGYWHNGRPVQKPTRGDDSRLLMDRAFAFIKRSRRQPFLAVIWFHTPHLPVQADDEHRRAYAGYSEKQQHYWGAIAAMDEQIGRLRAELQRLGLAGNTMLWFASDNGPEGDRESPEWPGTAGPWRGRKQSLFEGGIRVPALLEWPGKVKPGTQSNFAACTSDYFPTILEAVGGRVSGRRLDGVSLVPAIQGKAKERSQAIAFETMGGARGSPRLAWMENRYKLLSNLDGSPEMLFDLVADPGEKENLGEREPERCRVMREQLTAWREGCRASVAGGDYR